MGIKGIFCVVSIGLFTFIAAAEPAAVWEYQVSAGFADASPAIVDLDNDGRDDVVLTTTSGHIIALDPNGRERWQAEIQGPITIPPTAADLAADGHQCVLVMNRAGLQVCLDGESGAELWRHDSLGENEWGTTSIVTANVDAAPDLEVIAGDKAGRVVCLAADGALRWNYTGQQGWTFSPAAGDVTGDGVAEVLLAGAQVPLTCLSAEGKELWTYGIGEGASPVLSDLDGDGTNEIIGAQGNILFAVDGKGKELWRFEMKRPIDSALTVVDLTGDGAPEVYAADLSGQLVSVSADGKFLWDGNVEQRVRRSPSAGDVDGDGVAELLVAGYSGAIHVFTPEGYVKERVELGGTANATASIADFSGDGTPSVVCPLSSGKVVALRWPKAAPGAGVLWPQYRGTAARSGIVLSQADGPRARIASIDFGTFHVGSNVVSAAIENPDGQSLRLVLEVQQPGAPLSQAVIESKEAQFQGKLTYVISGAQSANLGLIATVLSGDKILDRRQRDVFVVPFKTELATLTRLLNEIEIDCPKMADASGIRERAFYLKSQLAGYAAQADLAGTMSDADRRTLRDDLAALLAEAQRMNDLAKAAAESGSRVLLAAANPWAPFGGMEEISEDRVGVDTVAISAFANETESAAVNVFNMTAAGMTFRVTLEPPDKEHAIPSGAVALREVIDVPTEMVDVSADALPRLNEAQIFALPGRSARQLWLDVDTSGLAAGEYETVVRLRSLDPEPLELSVPVKLTVWGAKLPDDPPLKLCHWGYVHSSVLKDIPEAALADQVAHGTDVFVGLFYPRANFDENGNIVGELDFTDHDEYVRAHSPHG
ncbi:MAG: PQQ-binding-like beta-propeller repeat protein, partial [Candidatus Hydrogenedentes bacterium]|nr:PQQ-binding-like beta-propeller repeat protein [Candidatus Hydrogenedentota bacterium]